MLPCKLKWNGGADAAGSATNPLPAPHPDPGSPRGFRDWLTILPVVSATLTLPGSAAIVLSIWLAPRWARTADQRADAAQQDAKKWHDATVVTQSEISDLKARLATLEAQLERRGRRRRLRR